MSLTVHQIDAVQQELAAASTALENGWRPRKSITDKQHAADEMQALIAQRRSFLKAQER